MDKTISTARQPDAEAVGQTRRPEMAQVLEDAEA